MLLKTDEYVKFEQPELAEGLRTLRSGGGGSQVYGASC